MVSTSVKIRRQFKTFKARATIILVKSQRGSWVKRTSWSCLAVFMLIGCQTQLGEKNIPSEEKIPVALAAEPLVDTLNTDTVSVVEPVSEAVRNIAISEDLWALLRRNLALDHQLDKRSVQQEIRWFQRNPRYKLSYFILWCYKENK